jgi:hypothetical protein
MRGLAPALMLLVSLAGCGGSGAPENAYLTGVEVHDETVRFEFESSPRQVRARYEQRSRLAECGSGRPVRVRGDAFVVVHFQPAASAKLDGEKVVMTYTGPKRLRGTGPVLEAAKSCDFEADLGWAIGLERRLPIDVTRDGSTVTVRLRTR